MADGTKEFTALEDGTYESTVQDGSLTVVTSYDENFEITGTEVQKTYENVRTFDEMDDKFKAAWEQATEYLPASWTSGAVQFAEEGNQILVIATADDNSLEGVNPVFLNGDVIGRITEWEGTNTWTRWFNDAEVDVESSDWNYNYHLEDWTYFANSGGREVNLINLTDDNGDPIDDQPDEVGQHVSGVAHKSSMPDDEWAGLQSEAGVSDDMLTRLELGWDAVNFIQVQDNNWSALENDYRDADDLWSDGEERVELHGFASPESTDTVFLGSITKRDGFIVLRDEQWGEVARLIDPDAASEDTTYDAMVETYGQPFEKMWPALDNVLPASLSSPEDLMYVEDQYGDILVFDANGDMVARLNHWGHSDTWERSWDDEFPSQTWTNNNFEVQVREVSEGGNGNWISLGRFEAGQSELTRSDNVSETEHSWERTSSTLYERNSEADDWAALETEYFSDVVAQNLSGIDTWADVDRIEVSENNSIYYPVAWRDQIETEESTSVRFYEEIEMDGGNWYRQKLLGSMEKRDGFIEIRDGNWETVARVVDVSDTSNLKNWDFIKSQYDGIAEAWDNAVLFFPDVASAFDEVTGFATEWGNSPLKTPSDLLFTTDDNTIYAFTAAGVMAAQINHWINEDEWERFYDDELLTVKNVHYNYNFHDADWNQIANSGGNERYVIDPETGAELLDEVGKNIGFMQAKEAVDPTLWATYDPSDESGTIDFTNVTEIRYETRSWESVPNKYRDESDDWSDSNVQIQYYEAVKDEDGNVIRDWPEFVGSVEQRDGFIELRDEHWRIVSKKVDGGETFLQMVTKYGDDFVKAWEALADSLPAEWTEVVEGDPAYEGFKFTTDKWDNILIFDTSGEMVGQVNYWSHVDQWSRSWDDDYPSQIHTNKNFHFQGMDTDAVTGNWHWVSIGEYQTGQDELVEPDGTTRELERSWENVGQTIFARMSEGDSETGAWNTTIKDAYYADAVADSLAGISDWSDVDRIEVSSNTYTHEAIRWRDSVEVEESVQVRFYEETQMDGGWYHTKFLGSMEKRDGFIEIRDENWETVARIADLNGSDVLTWTELQNATDADGNLLYPEIGEAWDAVKAFFPDIDMREPSLPGPIEGVDPILDDGSGSLDPNDPNYDPSLDPNDPPLGEPDPEAFLGFGTDPAYTFNGANLTTWAAGSSYFLDNASPEEDWDDPMDATDPESLSVLEYEFGYAVMDTILNGDYDPRALELDDTLITFTDTATGLAVKLDVAEGVEVDASGEVISGTVTGMTVTVHERLPLGQEPTTLLTADGITHGLTLETDIVPMREMMDSGDQKAEETIPLPNYEEEIPLEPFEVETQAGDWLENPLIDPTALTFTTDEEHIYAFTATGEMVGQINFWADENTWERYYDDEPLTVKNVHYNYNFHDAQWNQLANSGGNARYIVEEAEDGSVTLILDEVGSNIGFMQRVDAVEPTVWETFDPSDDTGTINWDNVVEIRYETHSWQSVSEGNPYREAEDDWSDSSVQIQYYEGVDGQNWTQFVGSKQERDGFIEIRDDEWNVVSKKVDQSLGMTYTQLLTDLGSDLDDAWTALETSLPLEIQDPNSLTFTKDQWDNILMFADTGEMIGQINYWSHVSDNERSWDDEYPREIHENKNFHFQGIETQEDGNWHWVSIGDYGTGSNTLVDPLGEELLDNSWVNVGQSMFARMSDADDPLSAWNTTIKDEYFTDAVAENLEDIDGWEDIDQIQVSSNTWRNEAIRWREEVDIEESIQVRFYEEIEMDGGWYHTKFLGIMEKRDGFIEIRDENWETITRVVDPDSATGFSEIAAAHPHLEWAWNEVSEYLPAEAVDPSALSFTEDEYNIFAFDDLGNMVVQINSWSWSEEFTDSLGILREESSYDYQFKDANWNEFASARKSQEYISDTNTSTDPDRTHQLDRENTGGSFRVRKEDVSDLEWAEYNPNDTSGTIIWDDIVEISIGINRWESFENFDRALDSTYADSEERVEYFELAVNQWGDSWPERVGIIETQGNLQTIYDKHWEPVGSQTKGDLEGVSLLDVLNDTDVELLVQFRSILEQYIDLDAAEIIEGDGTGPGILVENGKIVASVYYEQDFENADTQLYWDYDFRDMDNQSILNLGGWNQLETAGDDTTVMAKPNGVKIREYFYRDELDPSEWDALENEAGFNFEGFNWDDVGIVTKKVWKNDHSNEGYDTRIEYKFIKEDPASGRHDWNYFQTEIEEGGVTKVMDGDGSLLGYAYPAGSEPTSLVDEMGQGYATLLDALDAHLEMHHFQNMDIPVFSAGEFKAMGSSVTWTQNDGVSQLSVFGELEYSGTRNEWGDLDFRLRFDREDGNPLVEFSGWVSTDADGNADYRDADIRIREYVYKTDLESTDDPRAENTEWSTTMSLYGPSDTLKAQMGDIWDGVAPDVELVELESKYRYRDYELDGFDPENDSVKYSADEVRARFMEGSIDSTGDLDIEWTWELDYALEFSGGVVALMQGDNELALELDQQSMGPTPMPFVSHSDLFADQSTGQKYLDAIIAKHGAELEAAIPGFSSADLLYSGDFVLVVDSSNAVLARGDLWTDLTPNEWGHADFSLNFEGPNGHPSIGFMAYSSVDTDGYLDFADYGIGLREYFYKSEMDPADWALLKADYGPTDDLPIADWDTTVELIELQTRYRDGNADAADVALDPSFQRYEARFVEGYVDELDGDRLELFWDWETDDRIEIEGNIETHYVGEQMISTAVARNLEVTPVTDLESDFISGFTGLVESTEVLSGVIDPSGAFSLEVDNGNPPTLYVYDEYDELEATVSQASWFNDYEDVLQAYDLRSGEGEYLGWLWQSKDRDYIDLTETVHTSVRSEASNIVISKEYNELPLEAWKYLNDTFFAPAQEFTPNPLDYEFYDVAQVRIRQEKVVSYADPETPAVVNEHIFLQLDLPDQNNAARAGFDITNGKFIVYTDDWPDTTSDTYAADVAAHSATAVDVGTTVTAEVKLKVAEIMDALIYYDGGLPADFYTPAVVPPDANFDVIVDAHDMENALVAYDDMMNSLSMVPITESITVSENGEEFTMSVSGGSDTHVGTIVSASVTDFGTILKNYAEQEQISLDYIIDNLDIFVEDALTSANQFGDNVAYSASYSFNGDVIMTSDIEDADDLSYWEPIVYFDGDDMSMDPSGSLDPNDPNYDPENDPANDPNYDPANDPNYDPANDPNYDPANDPNYDPANDPNYDPANDPNYDPANDPNYDPANDGMMDEGGPEDAFLFAEGDNGEIYLYTPDDQFAMTVTGIGDLAADILAEDQSGSMTMEMAQKQAVDDFMMDFFGDDTMMDDHTMPEEIA